MADGHAHVFEAATSTDTDALGAFLAGLNDLSQRTGIAVGGAPELYVMEAEDRALSYTADAESHLVLS